MNRSKRIRLFIDTLIERRLTLALAESMTCGLAAHQLSTCKGTSEVLIGSVVCYTPEMKNQVLGVPLSLIHKYSPESPQVTKAMTNKLVKLVKAGVYAAVTGLAAPGGSENGVKPVGTVFYSVRHKGKTTQLRKLFQGTPLVIRQKAVLGLYDFILKVTG
jgi:nicotinamide-nucleotide amidase